MDTALTFSPMVINTQASIVMANHGAEVDTYGLQELLMKEILKKDLSTAKVDGKRNR